MSAEPAYVFPGSTPFIAVDPRVRVNATDIQRFAPFQRLTILLSQAPSAPTKEASQAILDAAAAELPAFEVALDAARDALRDVALGLGLDLAAAIEDEDEDEDEDDA